MAHLRRPRRSSSLALIRYPSSSTSVILAEPEDSGPRIITTKASLDSSRPFGQRQAITASGIPEKDLGQLGLANQMLLGSDDEIWRYYAGAAGGETRFFITRLRNLAARVTLRPEKWSPEARRWLPDPDPARQALVASLRGPHMSQENLLAQATGLMALVGHFRLLAYNWPGQPGDIAYEALSTNELQRASSSGTYTLRRAETAAATMLDSTEISVAWLWKAGLDHSGKPESSVRVALPILRMLERLNLSLSAIAESRLVGAGILLIARELDRKAPQDGKPTYRFADELEKVMMSALGDQGTAAARVPITIELQHQMVKDGIQFIDLAKQSDETILEYINHYLLRLARAFSWPDEGMVPGGAADLNHWTAWWVGEREYSEFFGPLLDDVVHSGFTTGWYHPILRDNGIDVSDLRVGFDPSAIRRKSEDVDKAVKLFNAGLVSATTALSVAGMDPETDGIDDTSDTAGRRKEMLDLAGKFPVYGAVLFPRLGYDLTPEELAALLNRGAPAASTAVEQPGPNAAGRDAPAPQPGDAHYRKPAGSGPSGNSNPEGPAGAVTAAAPVPPGPPPPPSPPPMAPRPARVSPPPPPAMPRPTPGVPSSPGRYAQADAVAVVVDAAIWASWTRAGNRLRNSARASLVAAGLDPKTLVPEHVGRTVPAPLLDDHRGQLFEAGWDIADRQLADLIADPGAFVRVAQLMRHTAAEAFFAPAPRGVRIIDRDLVSSTLS